MSDPLENIGGVFKELVNQFSDPLAFFRELIQNSIDAGTQQIEIWFEFQPPESGDVGTLIAHIDDFGEGMTRDIIENKLTRLFSSTKDDDFTKIGRFGIGFVSVFAIEPDAVVLDTARGGEAWRVIFHPDRTYDLISLDEPVEGTQIQVIKTMTAQASQELQARARKAIRTWCKHVSVPIMVEGEDVREPFDVESICKLEHHEEGTRVVMGFVDGLTPFGFYNRGLTLMEGHNKWWPNIAFKIDSRYLEHTLTRDRVLEDRHYHKAQDLLRELATQKLPQRLFENLEVAANARDSKTYEALIGMLSQANREGLVRWLDHRKRPVIPIQGGGTISLEQARKEFKKGRLFLVQGGEHLMNDERRAVDAAPSVQLRESLRAILGADAPFIEDWILQPIEVDYSQVAGAAALVAAMRLMVEACSEASTWLGFGDLRYVGSPFYDALAVVTPNALEVQRVSVVELATKQAMEAGEHVVLNAYEPRVMGCIRLASHEPELAALQLLKMMWVQQGLSAKLNEKLTRHTIEQRAQRART